MPSLSDTIRALPGVSQFRKRKYKRKFSSNINHNLFRGVYSTFADAKRDIPATKPVGYDNPEPAQMYREVMESIREWDYPVLYWLSRFETDVKSVFDFGGHIGILYYGFSKYLTFPDGFKWCVYDVPAVIEAGAEIAGERGDPHLGFSDTVAKASGFDVFLASGSLQYLEQPLVDILANLDALPPKLIVNMIPLHEREEFVTVNNMGTAYCPYKVFKKDEFLAQLAQQGWVLRDMWDNPGKSCEVPFYEEHHGVVYYGMYFDRVQ